MSAAMQFYVSVILIYLGIDLIACWGLNLQYGVAGVVNLAFIAFQAVGAYTAAILSMGPAQPQGYQTYFIGASLPFPVPIICAVLVGGVLSGLVGLVALRRLRSDLQAIVLLVFSLVATDIATNQVGFLNGSAWPVPDPAAAGIAAQPDTAGLPVVLRRVHCGRVPAGLLGRPPADRIAARSSHAERTG